MSLTDSRRLWVALRDAGEDGLHSHDIRKQGLSGNPAQRAKDIVSHGQAVWTCREARNGRPGSRYWLADFAPDWAVPVKPNGGVEVDGGMGSDSLPGQPAVDLNVIPAPTDCNEPVALVRDYDRDPHGPWREIPVSELEAA